MFLPFTKSGGRHNARVNEGLYNQLVPNGKVAQRGAPGVPCSGSDWLWGGGMTEGKGKREYSPCNRGSQAREPDGGAPG